VFDLSFEKLFVLAVIALIVFGPNELPKILSQAGRALRDLRRIAEGAKNDLREGLGPEFQNFEIEDLNPKRFVQKHLFDEPNGDNGNSRAAMGAQATLPPRANGTLLAPGERAPYDPDAT
jgi:sec-independent protein translocase protein TatB